jgi:hypothetical protein
MATGAQRRARRKASASLAQDVQRLHALRAMAEKDPPREEVASVLPNAHRTERWRKHSAIDTISTHGNVGEGSMYGRITDMPRSSTDTTVLGPDYMRKLKRNEADRNRRKKNRAQAMVHLQLLKNAGHLPQ